MILLGIIGIIGTPLVVFITLIVLIIQLSKQNNILKEKIKELEKGTLKTNNLESVIYQDIKIENKEKVNINNEKLKSIKVEETNNLNINKSKENKKNNIRKKQDDKNTLILITGSIFIVLAAIVFLTSTWNIVPNLVKTLILTALIGVFFGASNIAQKTFNLKKASQAFYYIALTYMPICLASISFFGLFGKYLSINGQGAWVYFSITGIILSLVYYSQFYNKKKKIIYISSLISQLFSVIATILIFCENIFIVGVAIVFYNLILLVISKDKITKNYVNIVSKIVFISFTYQALVMMKFNINIIICFIEIAVTEYILYKRNKKEIYGYFSIISIILAAFSLVNLNILEFTFDFKILIMLLICINIFVILNINKTDKKISFIGNILSIITVSLIYYIVLIIKTVFIKPYIITIILLAMFSLLYKINNKNKFIAWGISGIAILTGYHILISIGLNYHSYVIYPILIYTISLHIFLFKDKECYLAKVLKIMSYIILLGTFLILMFNKLFINDIIYFLILLGISIYKLRKAQSSKILYKIVIYILLNFTILSFIELLQLEKRLIYYIPFFVSLIIISIEAFIKKEKEKDTTILLAVLEGIAFIFLWVANTDISIIVSVLFSIYIFINNKLLNKNEKLNIIPLIGVLIPFTLINLENISTGLILNIFIILVTVLSIYKKRINLYTIFSFIFLIVLLSKTKNIYINTMIFITWNFIHLILNTERTDIFRFLGYSGIAYLYWIITEDIISTKYNSIQLIILPVYFYMIFKDILNKYIKTDILKNIIFSLVYISAFFNYNSETDGMIFVMSILIMIIVRLYKKRGRNIFC